MSTRIVFLKTGPTFKCERYWSWWAYFEGRHWGLLGWVITYAVIVILLLVMFCVILCLCLCITANLSSDCYCNLMSLLAFLASHSFGCLPDCYTGFSWVACSRDPRLHFLCNICYAGFYLCEWNSIRRTDCFPLLLETSVAKGGKMEAHAAPGLSYVDIPNTQIRKVNFNATIFLLRFIFVMTWECLSFYCLQVTANRLLASKQTIPHYYLTVDTCVDKLITYVLAVFCHLKDYFHLWYSSDVFFYFCLIQVPCFILIQVARGTESAAGCLGWKKNIYQRSCYQGNYLFHL
jgi:hypothetical protein